MGNTAYTIHGKQAHFLITCPSPIIFDGLKIQYLKCFQVQLLMIQGIKENRGIQMAILHRRAENSAFH